MNDQVKSERCSLGIPYKDGSPSNDIFGSALVVTSSRLYLFGVSGTREIHVGTIEEDESDGKWGTSSNWCKADIELPCTEAHSLITTNHGVYLMCHSRQAGYVSVVDDCGVLGDWSVFLPPSEDPDARRTYFRVQGSIVVAIRHPHRPSTQFRANLSDAGVIGEWKLHLKEQQ